MCTVNRAPIGGSSRSRVHYQKGQFLNAMNPASAERNEQNVITLRGEGADAGFENHVPSKLRACWRGAIVCRCAEGQTVERGARVRVLIKFGSRVDVLLPANAELRVKVGDSGKRRREACSLLFTPAGKTCRRRSQLSRPESAHEPH